MVDWLSLAVPLAYLGVLIGSLATFSSLYRKRKAKRASSLEPWFPPHLQRDIYFSLLHLEPPVPSSPKEKKPPAVPETVLKAALLRRATEDLRRVMTLRSQKQALALLLQRGSIGDDLWQRFLRAEKEMEDEVRDVVSEANAYTPNWGQIIFQSANEMLNNALFRQRLEAHQNKLAEERALWEKTKATAQQELMKELGMTETASNANSNSNKSHAVPADSSAKTSSISQPDAPPPPSTTSGNATDDDDAVLVEADDTPTPTSTSTSAAGPKKKKKGKK